MLVRRLTPLVRLAWTAEQVSRVRLAEEATRFVLGFCRLRKMPIDTPEMREEVKNACKVRSADSHR
jgi:hypothetical protein